MPTEVDTPTTLLDLREALKRSQRSSNKGRFEVLTTELLDLNDRVVHNGRIDQRLTHIESDLAEVKIDVAGLQAGMASLDTKISSVDDKVSQMDNKVNRLLAWTEQLAGWIERDERKGQQKQN